MSSLLVQLKSRDLDCTDIDQGTMQKLIPSEDHKSKENKDGDVRMGTVVRSPKMATGNNKNDSYTVYHKLESYVPDGHCSLSKDLDFVWEDLSKIRLLSDVIRTIWKNVQQTEIVPKTVLSAAAFLLVSLFGWTIWHVIRSREFACGYLLGYESVKMSWQLNFRSMDEDWTTMNQRYDHDLDSFRQKYLMFELSQIQFDLDQSRPSSKLMTYIQLYRTR